MQTLVYFLTKRVQRSDEDDWSKFKQGLMYLKGTMDTKLNITVDRLTTIWWYVDDSYGVHSGCKGHTGMMMTLGAGASMAMSKAHKLNPFLPTALKKHRVKNKINGKNRSHTLAATSKTETTSCF